MSDIYLSLTETPTVVTLSQPVVSGVLSSNVTVTNVVSVNVVTMPAITVQAAAPAVTTVAGSVAVSNFPVTQTIAGTVTANGGDFAGEQAGSKPPKAAYIGYWDENNLEFRGVSNINDPLPISGTVTANIFGRVPNDTAGVQLFPLPLISYDESIEEQVRQVVVPVQITRDQGTVTDANPLPISGSVTVGNSVTIGNTVTIAGTVTANPTGTQTIAGSVTIGAGTAQIGSVTASISGTVPISISSVTIGSLPAISGTVTANGLDSANGQPAVLPLGQPINGFGEYGMTVLATIGNESGSINLFNPLSISGTVTVGNSVTIGAMPNGSLTTRFGTPITANTSFATSAVTNASRKYLLIQNVTTQSNVITVGIGFTPTTTQGIQLTAGAGITFESSYIPTGQVYILSSVTASNFTILEA